MYHSIIISGKNTWDEWHLLPTSRPVVNPPAVRTQVIDLPGGNGFIDLTELLTGGPTYGSRTGSWTFIAHPDYHKSEPWNWKYQTIMEYLHGRHHRVVLEDDPAFYYEGRLSVNQWQTGANWSQIQIDYTLNPFKKEVLSSIEPWLWDPFSFVDGIIRNYSSVTISGTSANPTQITIRTGAETLIPTITNNGSSNITVSKEGSSGSYTLVPGTNRIAGLKLTQGDNILKFVGSGSVTIDFRGGWL